MSYESTFRRGIGRVGVAVVMAGGVAGAAQAKHHPAVGDAASPPPTAPPADFFPIGVYRQPMSSFEAWKSRGVNTVVDYYMPGAWQEKWTATAVADGLWMVRNPRANAAADVKQPYLLAWAQPDQADAGGAKAVTLAANYVAWKDADPSRDILMPLSGLGALAHDDAATETAYRNLMASADIVGSAIYPVSGWNRPQWIDKNAKLSARDPYSPNREPFNPGQGVQKLTDWSVGGKRQWAFIETSEPRAGTPQSIGARAPTAAEVRGETWDAILHGADGIVYFATTYPDTSKDGTPTAVASEIGKTDAVITRYGGVLDAAGSGGEFVNLPGGLEATYRDVGQKRYYFVLNFSHSTDGNATFTLPGVGGVASVAVPDEGRREAVSRGGITDSFAPYQLHVYTALLPASVHGGGVGASVPEPGNGAVAVVVVTGALGVRRRRRVLRST